MNSLNRKDQEGKVIAKMRLEFRMKIEDMFVIRGAGTVVTGVVETGMCNVGETAVIIHSGSETETEITRIILMGEHPKPAAAAHPNERVGLGLQGITREQLERGEIQIGDLVIVRNGQADFR